MHPRQMAWHGVVVWRVVCCAMLCLHAGAPGGDRVRLSGHQGDLLLPTQDTGVCVSGVVVSSADCFLLTQFRAALHCADCLQGDSRVCRCLNPTR
jgi:hypothetical protein